MHRKSFFKNIFGAAIVAAIPPSVLDAIISHETVLAEAACTKQGPLVFPDYSQERKVWLFDKEHILQGWGTIISVSMEGKRANLDIQPLNTPLYVSPVYISRHFFTVKDVVFLNKGTEYFFNKKYLSAIIVYDNLKFFCDCHITGLIGADEVTFEILGEIKAE